MFVLVEKYTRARIASGEIARKTAHDQRLTLLHFASTFGNRPLRQMGESDVLRWMAEIEGDRPSTKRRKYSEVKLFCRWMAGRRRRYIPYDPFIDLKPQRQPRSVPKIFDFEQIAVLLEASDLRLHLAILLGCQMGLRAGEAVGLELGDVGSTHALITGKGGHERYVPVVRQVRWALDDYMGERGMWAGHLLENYQRRGMGISAHTLSEMFLELCWSTGIKRGPHDGTSFHGLRRTCASHLAELGHSMLDIAEFLGHASMETTRKHYVKANSKRLITMAEGRWYGRRSMEQAG